jgi:uncharacterized membrane protein
MNTKFFQIIVIAIAISFTLFFCLSVVPALMQDFDIIGALLAGFVNPYSSGYSADVIACWLILCVWILFEKKTLKIKHGWICIVLGAVPGVAVGFALYLVLRQSQIIQKTIKAN